MRTKRTMLSLIIPVYRVEHLLERCLRSVLRQGVADLEVLLIDDASPDGSGKLCDKWAEADARFRVVHCSENGGLSRARNVGLDLACGEYVAFLDSDDFLADNTLADNLALLHRQSAADVVEFPIAIDHGAAGERLYRPAAKGEGSNMVDFAGWINRGGHLHCYACNKIYRRALWQNRRFEPGRLFEDMLCVPFVLENARGIVCSSAGRYMYCANGGSISRSRDERTLSEALKANLALYNHLARPEARFERCAVDLSYLAVCNSAIDNFRAGFKVDVPGRKLSVGALLRGKAGATAAGKALLNNLLGRNYPRVLAAVLNVLRRK